MLIIYLINKKIKSQIGLAIVLDSEKNNRELRDFHESIVTYNI